MTKTERQKLESAKAHLEKARELLGWYYDRQYAFEALVAGRKCQDATDDINIILGRTAA